MQSAAGFCLAVGDKLYFLSSGCKTQRNADPNTTGLAILRRDGSTSVDAGPREGTLTTRPVTFRGKHCFVNVAAAKSEHRVEVLDRAGSVIALFTKANCEPIAASLAVRLSRASRLAGVVLDSRRRAQYNDGLDSRVASVSASGSDAGRSVGISGLRACVSRVVATCRGPALAPRCEPARAGPRPRVWRQT